MSTPNPNALAPAHAEAVRRAVRIAFRQSGISSPEQVMEFIIDNWALLANEAAITARVDTDELDALKADLAVIEDQATKVKDEIRVRESR